MTSDKPLEIERKFLIHMPAVEALKALGGVPHSISQTYLHTGSNGENRRVRRSQAQETIIYTYTQKKRITDVTCIEEEREITEAEYTALLLQKRERSATLSKTRWKIPYEGHIVEVDIYPFWGDYAVLEVELASEDEAFAIPQEITILREVTGERLYKNTALADWLFAHPHEAPPVT